MNKKIILKKEFIDPNATELNSIEEKVNTVENVTDTGDNEDPEECYTPSQFASSFIGKSPDDILPGVTKEDVPRITFNALVDQVILIHGYIKLTGSEYKHKEIEKDFFLLTCTTDKNRRSPFVTVSGNKVIMKKLQSIGEKTGFDRPMKCEVVYRQKDDETGYYDIIDPK